MDGSEKRSLLCSSELSFAFSAVYLITPGGPKKKKKQHKTGSFLLFGKIVKKLIIIGASIINSITSNEKPFYGELKVFFFKKLENKGKGIIPICQWLL